MAKKYLVKETNIELDNGGSQQKYVDINSEKDVETIYTEMVSVNGKSSQMALEDITHKDVSHGVAVDIVDKSLTVAASTDDLISQISVKVSDNQGWVNSVQNSASKHWQSNKDLVVAVVAITCLAGYSAYLGYCMWYEFGNEESVRLLWMSLLGVFIVAWSLLDDYHGDDMEKMLVNPIAAVVNNWYTALKIVFFMAVAAGLIAVLVLVINRDPANLISLGGYLGITFLLFVFSSNPAKVSWRTVLWGFGLQFVFALLTLETTWGYTAVKWIGDRITEYLAYTDAGSMFVFGETFTDHSFAFQIMPVVLFFGATIAVLYHLGVMQAVIGKIAWVMIKTMGTTAGESVNAAGNIFLGQTESPLMIRPFIPKMTKSEVHAVLVGGYSTIAGSVMAAYILLGVPATHLVVASFMAAPCALACSKLSQPEVEKTVGRKETIELEATNYHNIFDAAASGAVASVPVVAGIIANIIVFIAGIEFINTTLTWMGHRAGLWAPEYQELSLELIFSYILWPFAYLMGVAVEDCGKVAELIGIKMVVNEFVAFTDLGIIIDNSETFKEYEANNGTWVEQSNGDIYLVDTNTTLYGGVMQDKSIIISTYALCGFANFSSVGVMIGQIAAMATNQTKVVSSIALKAMFVGTFVSILNGCIAGLLYQEGI